MTDLARLDLLRDDVARVLKRSSLKPKVLALVDEYREDLSPPAPPPSSASALYELVNEHRASVGAQRLSRDIVAESCAQRWAEQMARTGDFKHNPNLTVAVGDPWFSCGENIAWGYTDEAAVHRAWLDSPPHRRNIETPAYSHLGIGRAANATGRLYWVQVFVDRLA